MFKARLKYKNKFIDGYFIDLNGNIYDDKFVKQETYISTKGYQTFKSHHVHVMMAHSFYGYKPGYDVHHLNQLKIDNRLQNLLYLTHKEHIKIHMLGKTLSEEHKQKLRDSKDKKKVRCLETDIVYESVRTASRELNIHCGRLSQHLNKKYGYKSIGELHFQFVLE